MKDLLLIGIGPGDPRQVTYEAVDALRQASVFFVLDKGGDKDELVHLRKAILQRYRPEGGYRLVQVADPARDGQADDYLGAVQDWHRQRAALYAQLIEQEIGIGETGAFLLWGEPTLYDSTLRILGLVRERGVALRLQVIPGISSVQALAARHQVPLNRIGEPLTVLPGRRLAGQGQIDNVLVMLDGQCAFARLDDPALMIYWGAYLGTADEVLIAGPLQAVKAQIMEVRERERARKGWIMDSYLLRREL
ncbi:MULTISPECIES: precorrin-6A synthase (deacetylating) [Pseudomonas]|uniref:Precorrin-6A synthase (Deacetylating) n=1 Tax=Pseudomonas asiatica TaxID=2219225 RepID=A0A9X4D344_9PSED|nr:precorrin-6A synthase (deacetylating) [Pseudomonas asiatica]MEE1903686.1 precorrin-6A synthase (deacetylating) [Pseudomonas inefficax]MDD2107337.1 precorrin-6A synthase (deacetylating) [Pseudomonas asiatica]MEE1909408.1 precorrin-6A synthase (deacetylating) [Pseudomonas inefficax]MEE1986775.1 precorrin-6A synthase (deacetylating) [Pseudomonas inefficax]WJN52416.1 precorrin-6A synthase (deacetylating) [Pseudomonas asiatica]